jgi:hypothetical protein
MGLQPPAGHTFLQAPAGPPPPAGLGKPPGRPWFSLLQDFLQAGCPGRVQCRQILAAAADAAEGDAAAAAAGVGLLLRQLLALQETQMSPPDVVEAARSLLNQVRQPAALHHNFLLRFILIVVCRPSSIFHFAKLSE